jgi:SAM-dependent methyltransferase
MRNLLKEYKTFDIDPKKLRSADFFSDLMAYRRTVMNRYRKLIKRRVSAFSCPLCRGIKGTEFLNCGKYVLVECKKCGLVSPNIDFTGLEKAEFYNDSDYVEDTKREILSTYEYRKKTYAPERLNYILRKIKDVKKEKIKLLDVGCGPGYFLSYLKDNKISYKGIELADFLVDVCRKKGLNVEKIKVEDEAKNAYNIVTLYDVLEHISRPVDFMNSISNALVKGGYVVVYTPNIHSVSYVLMKGMQNTLLPFQHLCFYDKASVDYLCDKTGFKVVATENYGLDIIDYFCMRQYLDGFDYLAKLKDFIKVIQSIVDKQGLSNHTRIILKKK